MYKNVYNKHLFRLNGGKLQPINGNKVYDRLFIL